MGSSPRKIDLFVQNSHWGSSRIRIVCGTFIILFGFLLHKCILNILSCFSMHIFVLQKSSCWVLNYILFGKSLYLFLVFSKTNVEYFPGVLNTSNPYTFLFILTLPLPPPLTFPPHITNLNIGALSPFFKKKMTVKLCFPQPEYPNAAVSDLNWEEKVNWTNIFL